MPSRCTDRRTPRYFVHLLAAFKIELLGGVLHAIFVGDDLAGLDTEQGVVRLGVLLVDVVRVVGANDLEVELLG